MSAKRCSIKLRKTVCLIICLLLFLSECKGRKTQTVIDDNYRTTYEVFVGSFCDAPETAMTIKSVYERHNYLCDTHTAVGLNCALRYLGTSGDRRKIIVASTASPYKFAPSVYNALTGETLDSEFDTINALSKLTSTEVPAPLASLLDKQIRFDKVIDPVTMIGEVYAAIKK